MTAVRAGRLRASVLTVLLLTASLSSSLAPGLASAQAPAESSAYRSTVQRAVSEFEAGNYAEARGLFLQAHKAYPNARTLRGLGLVEFELRNYAECVRYLDAALASSEKPLTADQREQAAQALERARAFIAQVHLDLTPSSARVLVDGVEATREPTDELTLQVGDHLIEVQATGYLAERKAISIGGGERLEVKFVLQKPAEVGLHSELTKSSPDHDDTPTSRRWYKNAWLWTGLAVVAGGVGLGVALALRPGTRHETEKPSTTGNTPTGGVLQTLGSW